MKRQQVLAGDLHAYLEGPHAEGPRRTLRRLDVAARAENEVAAFGVELPRGTIGRAVACQGAGGPLGNVESLDHPFEARLAERDIEPEEVPALAERRDPFSLLAPQPVEDLGHDCPIRFHSCRGRLKGVRGVGAGVDTSTSASWC